MTDAAVDDPGRRGTMTVADRVIDKLAEQAASSVAGVVPSGNALDKLVGRRLPSVSSAVRGDQARVSVEIAVSWPMSLADVASSVREKVAETVTDLAGLHVAAVDVSVSRVEYAAEHRRRVE